MTNVTIGIFLKRYMSFKIITQWYIKSRIDSKLYRMLKCFLSVGVSFTMFSTRLHWDSLKLASLLNGWMIFNAFYNKHYELKYKEVQQFKSYSGENILKAFSYQDLLFASYIFYFGLGVSLIVFVFEMSGKCFKSTK